MKQSGLAPEPLVDEYHGTNEQYCHQGHVPTGRTAGTGRDDIGPRAVRSLRATDALVRLNNVKAAPNTQGVGARRLGERQSRAKKAFPFVVKRSKGCSSEQWNTC